MIVIDFFLYNMNFQERRNKIEKDFCYDICHNKSLALSFDTDTCWYRLTISNPPAGVSLLPLNCLIELYHFSYKLSI